MLFNIMHRAALGAKYPIFREQQKLLHELKIKGTVFVHYKDLFDANLIRSVKEDASVYGDEIGLALHDMTGPALDAIVGNLPAFWLFSLENKKKILETILAKYKEVFGDHPKSIASYHFDSSSLRLLKEQCPECETIVGGCFEEGVRVFHGCNHSWYLFNEGMPWGPWFPSKEHSLRPATSEVDSAGLVAVPHLVRDMSLSYEGRNDFWASHPPNVVRGMGNEASFNPYDLNLIDQYRMQEKINGRPAYLNTFVGVNWLTWNHNSEYPPEVCWHLYRTMLQYLVELRDSGEAIDMTLSEYGQWHRNNRAYAEPEVYHSKELLYGSGKHYFWYLDGAQRLLVDPTQGGSIGDLRSYVGRCPVETGPDSKHREIGSYPYLIQSQHRTGFAHHHEDGSRTTVFLECNGEQIDFAAIRTKVDEVTREGGSTRLQLTPARFQFANGISGELVTSYHWDANTGVTQIERKIQNLSDPDQTLTLIEHFKGAPGKTEYAEDLSDIVLLVNEDDATAVNYDYAGRYIDFSAATQATARIPQINTAVHLVACSPNSTGAGVKCGNLFSPFVTLQLKYEFQGNETVQTEIRIEHLDSSK